MKRLSKREQAYLEVNKSLEDIIMECGADGNTPIANLAASTIKTIAEIRKIERHTDKKDLAASAALYFGISFLGLVLFLVLFMSKSAIDVESSALNMFKVKYSGNVITTYAKLGKERTVEQKESDKELLNKVDIQYNKTKSIGMIQSALHVSEYSTEMWRLMVEISDKQNELNKLEKKN